MKQRMWKRIKCRLTLNHIDPGIDNRSRCKRCGAHIDCTPREWKREARREDERL